MIEVRKAIPGTAERILSMILSGLPGGRPIAFRTAGAQCWMGMSR